MYSRKLTAYKRAVGAGRNKTELTEQNPRLYDRAPYIRSNLKITNKQKQNRKCKEHHFLTWTNVFSYF